MFFLSPLSPHVVILDQGANVVIDFIPREAKDKVLSVDLIILSVQAVSRTIFGSPGQVFAWFRDRVPLGNVSDRENLSSVVSAGRN